MSVGERSAIVSTIWRSSQRGAFVVGGIWVRLEYRESGRIIGDCFLHDLGLFVEVLLPSGDDFCNGIASQVLSPENRWPRPDAQRPPIDLLPFDPEKMTARKVDKAVGNVKNDSPRLIEPASVTSESSENRSPETPGLLFGP